jgi:hypothetical protein
MSILENLESYFYNFHYRGINMLKEYIRKKIINMSSPVYSCAKIMAKVKSQMLGQREYLYTFNTCVLRM